MPQRRRTPTRRNPAPRYSRAKLEALRTILNKLIAHFADERVIQRLHDYPREAVWFQQSLLRDAAKTVLGEHVGLNADFVNEALHLGSGRALREAGEPYLFFGDDDNVFEVVMHDGDEDGSLTIEDITGPLNPVQLVQWVEKTLNTL